MKPIPTALSALLVLTIPAQAETGRLSDARAEAAFQAAAAARMNYEPERAEKILETLVAARPNAAQLRFELGVARAEQGRCAAASRTFSHAGALARTPGFQRAVEAAMADLCPRLAPIEASLGFTLHYDTNANGGAGDSEFEIYDRPVTLSDDAVAQARAGYTLSGNLAYNLPIGPVTYAVPSLGFAFTDYEQSDLDELQVSGRLALRRRGDILDIRGGPAGFVAFDREGLLQAGLGVSFDGSLEIDKATGVFFDGSWYDVEDADNRLRDHERLSFGAELVRAFETRNMLGRIGVDYTAWDYTDDLQDLSSIEAEIGLSGSLTDRIGFDFAVSHTWQEGEIADPFLGVVREDDITTLSANVSFGRFEGLLGRPYVGASYSISESSFDMKDYDRTKLDIGFTRRF